MIDDHGIYVQIEERPSAFAEAPDEDHVESLARALVAAWETLPPDSFDLTISASLSA